MDINLKLENDCVVLVRQGQPDVEVERIDTASKSYVLGLTRIGDAIRTNTPVLVVDSVAVAGAGLLPQTTLRGIVYGYPDKDMDGRHMKTATITALHLQGGEIVRTAFGLQQESVLGSGFLRAVREVVGKGGWTPT